MTTENNLQKAYDTSYLHIFKMAFLRKLGNKIDMYTLNSHITELWIIVHSPEKTCIDGHTRWYIFFNIGSYPVSNQFKIYDWT